MDQVEGRIVADDGVKMTIAVSLNQHLAWMGEEILESEHALGELDREYEKKRCELVGILEEDRREYFETLEEIRRVGPEEARRIP